jgi:hypothetical protein
MVLGGPQSISEEVVYAFPERFKSALLARLLPRGFGLCSAFAGW